MRFTTFLVSGALAAVAVAQSGTSSAAPSATTSASAPESPADKCLKACAAGDVNCKAHCITVSRLFNRLFFTSWPPAGHLVFA